MKHTSMAIKKYAVGLLIGSLVFIFLSNAPSLFSPGLEDLEEIQPYLDGVFPATTPSENIQVVPAFPEKFSWPLTFAEHPTKDSIFIGQRDGIIYYIDNDSTTNRKDVFLNLKDSVGFVEDGGFLGMALHPDFGLPDSVGRNYFYVWYNTKDANGADFPNTGTGIFCVEDNYNYFGNYLKLVRYEVIENTMEVNTTVGELVMIRMRMYNSTHRGGGMVFGQDGFLYLTIGDQSQFTTAQDLRENLDGGVLRIDVDMDPTKSHAPIRVHPQDPRGPDEISGVGYYIPNDNPFNNPDGSIFEEYYSYGHRNPHRLTMDIATGEMYIGEIGSSQHEEINVLTKGGNYGWPVYEGFKLIQNCMMDTLNSMGTYIPPLVAFPRATANAIIGGFVYRGSTVPDLNGKYICADYGFGDEIFSVDIFTGEYEQLTSYPGSGKVIGFGQTSDGEIYIMRSQFGTFYKLAVSPGYQEPPAQLSGTGAFTDLSTLTTAPGIIPYEMIEPFWSDGTYKKRWLALANDGTSVQASEQIEFSDKGIWDFPVGTVIIKHFDLPISDLNSALTRKLETRFSIKGSNGNFYYLTYQWRDDGSDADLLSIAKDTTFSITTTGGTRGQEYHFPSRGECLGCHDNDLGGSLGPRTRNLNSLYSYEKTGKISNQLVTLSSLGFLDQTVDYAQVDSFLTVSNKQDSLKSLEDRARSYLDVNCGYCHRPGTGNRANFDARYITEMEFTNFFSQDLNESIGLPEEWIIYPGDTSKSVLYQRMITSDKSLAMPPLGKNVIDTAGVELIAEWIMSMNPGITSCNPANLTLNRTATQSSTDGSSDPELAIDGDTDGGNNDISKTNSELEPWWEIDLGEIQNLKNIVIWNSTGCCTADLTDFHVFVSDEPFLATDIAATQLQEGVKDIYHPGDAEIENYLDINRTGRYLRIQKEGTGLLALAEVQIFGCLPEAFSGNVIGEVGLVEVEEEAKAVQVNFEFEYENPIVIAGPSDYENVEPSPVRIRDVTNTGFVIYEPEWSCYNKFRSPEFIPYIVIEAGAYVLENGQTIMAGKIDTATHNWSTIQFPTAFATTPLVFTQSLSSNFPDQIVVKVDPTQTSTTQTAVKLTEEEGADGIHLNESLGWIAVESGIHSSTPLFEFGASAASIDDVFSTIAFAQNYTNAAPIFIASIASNNNTDPSTIRQRFLTNTSFSADVLIQEEVCDDAEVLVTPESINYMVFDAIGGIEGTPLPALNTDLGIFTAKADVGTVGLTGNSFYANGYYFQSASGLGIENMADEFQYIHRPHDGNGEIIARVLSIENTDPNAKAGIMFRETTAAGAKMIALVQHPDNQVSFEWRTADGAMTIDTIPLQGGTDDIKFLKLIRSDDVFRAFYSTESYAGPWTQIGPKVEIAMAPSITVGLINSSNDNLNVGKSTFDFVSVLETDVFWANQIGAKIYLQGVWDDMAEEMKTDLRLNNLIPLEQPYSGAPWDYEGWECVDAIPADVVDWVLVQIRDADDHNTILKQRACFLRKDGVIVDLFGNEGIDFGFSNYESAYVCVIHRNHQGVLTNDPVDFE